MRLRRAHYPDAETLAVWEHTSIAKQKRWLRAQWTAKHSVYMAMLGDLPVGWGVIEHGAFHDELRWGIAPNHRHRGYGKKLARLLKANAVQIVMATISPHNHFSAQIARHIGLHRDGVDHRGYDCWVE